MAPDTADNNGRVTLAILATKLDYLIHSVDLMNAKVTDNSKTCIEFGEWRTGHKQAHTEHADLHKRERGIFAVIAVAATAVGSMFGIIKP